MVWAWEQFRDVRNLWANSSRSPSTLLSKEKRKGFPRCLKNLPGALAKERMRCQDSDELPFSLQILPGWETNLKD
jgi:hypothetical protein